VRGGVQQTSDRRSTCIAGILAMAETAPLTAALEASGMKACFMRMSTIRAGWLLYMERQPRLLRQHGTPFSTRTVRRAVSKPETHDGRTYALGHEPTWKNADGSFAQACHRTRIWPWAVWYPSPQGRVHALSPRNNGCLREHGTIGHAFGTAAMRRTFG